MAVSRGSGAGTTPPPKTTPKTTVPLSPNSPVDRGAGNKPADSWGMATDIGELWVWVEGNKVENIRERVVADGCKIKLTIDGAHTVTISLDDYDRKILLGKNIIRHKSQVFLQSRWWTLVQGSKNGDQLDLTFEDAHVANLRTYGKRLVLPKTWGSRCQFVWRLVLEAAATDKSLNYEAPCAGQNIPPKLINSVLGLQTPSSPYIRDPYVSAKPTTKKNIYIKSALADAQQLANINAIMDACAEKKVRRKVAVAAIMTGIHETSIRNLSFLESPTTVEGVTPHPHRGVWQQDPFYWPASGNVHTDAIGDGTHDGFVTACNKVDHQLPNISVNELCYSTQYPGHRGSPYEFFGPGGQYRIQAERIVTAWGWSGGDITSTLPKNQQPKDKSATGGQDPITIPPGFDPKATGGGSNNQWHRGAPRSKKGVRRFEDENSWLCIGRLASEVNWYYFMLGDYLVFAPGDWLFAKKIDYTFKEFDKGVGYIDFDYDVNKKNATCTIHTRIEEWPVDPGNCIELEDMGIVDGKWLVSAYERSLFSHEVTVTCVKPKPKFPEPTTTSNIWSPGTTTGGEVVPPAKTPVIKGDIRHAIAAWAVSGTKGPPPFYRSPSDPINKKPGFWPERLDCSGFVIQCYCWGSKDDSKYDPAQNNYGGGSTASMYPNGRTIPQAQAQMADVVIWSAGVAVGGDREHTAVFTEDWHGDGTAMVSHGGGTPGPHSTTFGDENDWQIVHHGARPTVKNYID
jgi:hypothetical protein